MICSITDDAMSDPEFSFSIKGETGMSRIEEMDLRLQAMSQKMHQVMRGLDDSNESLRRDLAGVQNGIMLTLVDLDDLER